MRLNDPMLFPRQDHETLYNAFLARDPVYDGRVYAGVSTTGVFCRLTCPARKPRPENCRFFESVAACIEAGFRPCKRCHPLSFADGAEPAVRTLLSCLEKEPGRRWAEADLEDMGFDPSTVRRAFKRQFGMTFLEMARLARLRGAFVSLAAGERVINAQVTAGFDSASGFRTAFAKLLGQAPSMLARNGPLRAHWIDTPIGAMIAVSDTSALHLLEFADRRRLPSELKKLWQWSRGGIGIGRYHATEQVEGELKAYFARASAVFEVPVVMHGTPFQREVWQQLRQIPVGETRSYGELARSLGRPTAMRAVARANGANQLALVIPCHRVIGADGSLTGYGGGLWRKRTLIDVEKELAGGGG
jgi:AraC family transcriptional regulator, regulatory protein of adaptative response / methylated-DNA-[protein]-cysteine methyltransferase